jgi:hypothetical protein
MTASDISEIILHLAYLLAHLRLVYLERSVDMATPKIRSANAVRVNLIKRHHAEMSKVYVPPHPLTVHLCLPCST